MTSGAAPMASTANAITRTVVEVACVITAIPTIVNAMPAGISTPGRIRWASRGANWKARVDVSMPGTSAIPAASGVMPCTSWKYCATNTITPPDSIEYVIMLPSDTLKVRRVNSRTSTSGSARRR